ncbi:DUF5994 family protein [Kitasatospora sp. NPDC057223]|uniref:DUF5994 family protein n=1 Tax=Kitasatospora sp. NPDC057223 TaxID=3346055 RepID=UPI00363AECB3
MTFDRETTAPRTPAAQLRLSLTPDDTAAGRLDGAWWPRSHDLPAELPSLAKGLDERWGRVTRVTLNPTHWPTIPPRIPVTGHVVHAGWFLEEQDPNEIMVRSYAPRRLDLLMIPPDTDPADAADLMAAAADPANTRTASALLAERPTEHLPAGAGR